MSIFEVENQTYITYKTMQDIDEKMMFLWKPWIISVLGSSLGTIEQFKARHFFTFV
jgi:hypothetical protein